MSLYMYDNLDDNKPVRPDYILLEINILATNHRAYKYA